MFYRHTSRHSLPDPAFLRYDVDPPHHARPTHTTFHAVARTLFVCDALFDPAPPLASEEIPEVAWSNQTQFRWVQPNFENARDHWALDDVSVFHRFKPKWHSTEPFLSVKRDARAAIHVAQCCLGSIQCQLRLSPEEKTAQVCEGGREGGLCV